VEHIVGLIERAETNQDSVSMGSEENAQSCNAGTLVFNPMLGVTMLYKDAAPKQFYVVNFSRADCDQRYFGARVSPVLSGGKPYVLFLAPLELPAA
jgi:hypothetical protein